MEVFGKEIDFNITDENREKIFYIGSGIVIFLGLLFFIIFPILRVKDEKKQLR